MPKRIGFLYERLLDKDFLKSCVKASLTKKNKKRRDVHKVVKDIDGTVDRMYRIFAAYDYMPTEPKIKDKKFLLLIAVAATAYQPGLKYAMDHNLTAYDVVGDR